MSDGPSTARRRRPGLGFAGRQIAALTLVAAAVAFSTSLIHAALLVRARMREVRESARLNAQTLCLEVLRTAGTGADEPTWRRIEAEPGVRSQIDALVGYSPVLLSVTVSDASGTARLQSHPAAGNAPPARAESLETFPDRNPLVQLVRVIAADTTLALDVPCGPDRPALASVEIAVTTLFVKNELFRPVLDSVLVATFVVLVAFLGSLFVAAWLLTPFQKLREALVRIDTGAGQPRLDLRDEGDVERIASFFESVGRAATDRAPGPRAAEPGERRLEALGTMTSAVAHQIRAPLHTMVLRIAALREKLGPDAERTLEPLEEDVRRLDEILEGFLRLARHESARLEPVSLAICLEDVGARWAAQGRARGVRVVTDLERDLPTVFGSPSLLREALDNIVGNALEALPPGGSVTLHGLRAEPGRVKVIVRDSGPGIPSHVLPRVFDLYFTTKNDGSGIGLPLVKRIAELHGGDVSVASEEGRGTIVTLTLRECA